MHLLRKFEQLRALLRKAKNFDVSDLKDSNDIKSMRVNIGQIQAKLNAQLESISNLKEVEFQVFSQWGEDGILQYLISVLDIPNETFIEFGVEDYQESNSRLLAIMNNWSGLVIDGSEENFNYFTKSDSVAWRNDIQFINAFVTAESIERYIQLFLNRGFSPEIGLLSVDIDGMDYWVFKKIKSIQPIILILEYNSVFGLEPLTLPYVEDFVWKNEPGTHQYWGAGLAALHDVAESKGYIFIGCNSAGNNAFFVRKDKWVSALPKPTLSEGFVLAKFNEGGAKPNKTRGGKKILDMKKELPLYNTINESIVHINNLK